MMAKENQPGDLQNRQAPVDLSANEFRELGYQLIDRISEFLETLPERPVTTGVSAKTVRELIGRGDLPADGTPPGKLLDEVAGQLFDHSLHNGHPRFFGYITSPAAPLGALADCLAAILNANLGMWDLSPVATEIEAQTIRWIAELIGYPTDCGGLMVSGGNMANFLGFMAARKAKAPWDIREKGLYADPRRLTVYTSRETHTWIEKATDVAGLGTDAIRWIATDNQQRMKLADLETQINKDIGNGCLPFIVIGTAGNVSTGAIDALPEIATIAKAHDLWFHVDGAYGAPAAALPEASSALKALSEADSIAFDPHKWLYSPLEAACTLVRDADALPNAFSFHPPYYHLDTSDEEPGHNYYEYGMQNSRGFRALKVWLNLRHAGRNGQVQMIRDDIALAVQLFELADQHPELEACTQNLSITTFRFVPSELTPGDKATESYLNELNKELLHQLQTGGEAFVSNAVIDDKYLLRACVVNFRSTLDDIEALPEIVIRLGRQIDAELRSKTAS